MSFSTKFEHLWACRAAPAPCLCLRSSSHDFTLVSHSRISSIPSDELLVEKKQEKRFVLKPINQKVPGNLFFVIVALCEVQREQDTEELGEGIHIACPWRKMCWC